MNEEIIRSRIEFEKLGDNYPNAAGVSVDKEIIEDVVCYWIQHSENKRNSEIVVYLHGGCFVFGSIRSHLALVSNLAKELELPFVFIEYGLAPEKPYPHAFNEIVAVYRKLAVRYPDSKFIVMGDSAGGWLTVALTSKLYNLGIPAPKFCIVISPWMDLSCKSKSITENAGRDPILKKDRLQFLIEFYCDGHDLSALYPIDQIDEKFPPTLILVGSEEILLDDSKLLYNKILLYQSRTRLSIYKNQTHVWLLDDIHTDPSQRAMREIKSFLEGSD